MNEVSYSYTTVDSARADAAQTQLAAAAREIEHLKSALESARTIGAAIGIVMAMQKITYDAAFAMLAAVSQHQNRNLREIADDVVNYDSILDGHPHRVPLAS